MQTFPVFNNDANNFIIINIAIDITILPMVWLIVQNIIFEFLIEVHYWTHGSGAIIIDTY